MTRDYFQTGAEVVVGPRCLGAEVTRGRGGSGAEVSEFHSEYLWCLQMYYTIICACIYLGVRAVQKAFGSITHGYIIVVERICGRTDMSINPRFMVYFPGLGSYFFIL